MISVLETIQTKPDEIITVHLTSAIPLDIAVFGRRSEDEYKQIVRESLQIETQTIFKHIQVLSSLENGFEQDFKVADFREILQTLSYIGKALIEAQTDDALEIDKARCHLQPEKQESGSNS